MGKLRVQTVAVDLGPERSGVAVLKRGFMNVPAKRGIPGYRAGFNDVAAMTLRNGEVCTIIKRLRPKFVLVERCAEGYKQKEAKEALKEVEAAVDRSVSTLCVAACVQWTKEAFRSARVSKSRKAEVARFRLERLLVEPEAAERIWQETAGIANRNARSALILLACWEPLSMLLARGRWGPKVELLDDRPASSEELKVVSRGARRLYPVLWQAGKQKACAGKALLAEAAEVSSKSIDRYLEELEGCDFVRLKYDGRNKLAKIVVR